MSHLGKSKIIFKSALVGDMLIPRRVLPTWYCQNRPCLFSARGCSDEKHETVKLWRFPSRKVKGEAQTMGTGGCFLVEHDIVKVTKSSNHHDIKTTVSRNIDAWGCCQNPGSQRVNNLFIFDEGKPNSTFMDSNWFSCV